MPHRKPTGLFDMDLLVSTSITTLLRFPKPANISEKSPPKLNPKSLFWSSFGGVAVLAELDVVAALALADCSSAVGELGSLGEGRDGCLWRPQDNVRPAFLSEKAEVDLGIGGASKDFSFCDLQSSRCGTSVDEGAVEVALSRDELSVVDAVFVFDAPLPLYQVSRSILEGIPDFRSPNGQHTDSFRRLQTYYRLLNEALSLIYHELGRLLP